MIETDAPGGRFGSVKYGPARAELNSLIYRRSVYVAENMKAGDYFTTEPADRSPATAFIEIL